MLKINDLFENFDLAYEMLDNYDYDCIEINKITVVFSEEPSKSCNYKDVIQLIIDTITKAVRNLKYKFNRLKDVDMSKFLFGNQNINISESGTFMGQSGKHTQTYLYGTNLNLPNNDITGKDYLNPDVNGLILCRYLAINILRDLNLDSAYVTMKFLPGKKEPVLIEAYAVDFFGMKTNIKSNIISDVNQFSIEDNARKVIDLYYNPYKYDKTEPNVDHVNFTFKY